DRAWPRREQGQAPGADEEVSLRAQGPVREAPRDGREDAGPARGDRREERRIDRQERRDPDVTGARGTRSDLERLRAGEVVVRRGREAPGDPQGSGLAHAGAAGEGRSGIRSAQERLRRGEPGFRRGEEDGRGAREGDRCRSGEGDRGGRQGGEEGGSGGGEGAEGRGQRRAG